jgi:glycine/D-amino acid oxidase-like deaminating enzyme
MPALPRSADIVVIGAGAIGTSIAYHLARRGTRDVVVLEREMVGAGSTSKAAGGIRVEFPLEIEVEFSLRGIEFFKRFRDEMGAECDFRQEGYLFLLTTEADVARFRKNMQVQHALGADTRLIGPDDARQIVPSLRVDDVLAAVWGPQDGYASPNDVVQAYAAQARGRGVKIVEETAVTGIELEGGRVAAVQTTAGRVATPLCVNAAGPWAPLIGEMAGLHLPVDPRRRHIFVTDAFTEVKHPIPLLTDRSTGFYCRSEQQAILMSAGDIGTSTEYTATVDWSMLEEAVRKAVNRIPALESAQIRHAWAGLRPLTPDEHAIIDWAPGVEGLFLAIGFCGHGFQHSYATGQVTAEWLVDGKPGLDISDLSMRRF